MSRVTADVISTPAHPIDPEIETSEFMGRKLTPLSQQNNAALKGTQYIDRGAYRLTVDGRVNRVLSLSYTDLQRYPQISRLVELDCVEGWNYTAKWTGPSLKAIFDRAGVKSDARIAIFHTADMPEGFSSLDLKYIYNNNIIIALKDNDITLPPDKGFPFQVVAMSKFKWAKWVNRIELSSDYGFRGSSESNVYNAVFCNCGSSGPWWWPWKLT